MDSLLEVIAFLAKASGMGAVSFLTQRLLADAQQRLSKLRSQSNLSERDKDVEELLTHLEDEVGSLDSPEPGSVRIIRLRIGLSIAFWRMRFQAIIDRGRNRAE